MLSPQEKAEIEAELAKLPQRRAGTVDALKAVQRHRGWVDDEALADVAELLGVSPAELDGVATFYSLIFRRPVGRHVILVCESVSCWILGYEEIRRALGRRLGVEPGQTSADGRFTLLTIPCLGCCDHAPAMMVDEDLHQDLTVEALDGILARYE